MHAFNPDDRLDPAYIAECIMSHNEGPITLSNQVNAAQPEKDAERLNFMDCPRREIGYDIDPEKEELFVIYDVHGSRNDREWVEIGRGSSIRMAIDAAIAKQHDNRGKP